MAINTKPKRQSALLFLQPSNPMPDGSVNVDDRAQCMQLYRFGTYGSSGPTVTSSSRYYRRGQDQGQRSGAGRPFAARR